MLTVIAIGVWAITSVVLVTALHRAHHAATPTPPPPPEPFVDAEGTQWIPFLPPVPPAQRRPDLEGFRLDAKFYAVLADTWVV